MARVINYGDDDLRANQRMMRSLSNDAVSNPFAFAAQAPVAPAMLAPVAAPATAPAAPVAAPVAAPAAAPVVQAAAPVGSRRGDVQPAPTGPSQQYMKAGIIEVPKPPAILAEEQRLGGKQLEPIYAQGKVERGRTEQTVEYGPPIGYRYDNGQSQYVNFDASGEYQGTVDRQKGIDPALLLMLLPILGPMAIEGLLGAAGETAALGAGQVAAAGETAALGAGAANLTPAAIESLLGTAGYGANASALEFAKQLGLNLATVGAGANLPFPGVTPTPIPTPPPPIPKLTPAAIESLLGTSGYGTNASALEFAKQYGLDLATVGSGANLPFDGVTPSMPPVPEPSKLPSWVNPTNALLAASAVSSIAKANETAPTAPTFTMAPYVPPSGRPFANIAMSPIATPYTPTRILGQYDPTMTPGGVSPYELIMAQMQAPKNLYADFEAGTNIGGFDPQKFVIPPAAAAAAPPNNMGGTTVSGGLPNANLGAALPGEINPAALGAAFGTALPNNMGGTTVYGSALPNYMPGIEAANLGTGLPNNMNGIELMNAINSGKISKGNLFGLLQA